MYSLAGGGGTLTLVAPGGSVRRSTRRFARHQHQGGVQPRRLGVRWTGAGRRRAGIGSTGTLYLRHPTTRAPSTWPIRSRCSRTPTPPSFPTRGRWSAAAGRASCRSLPLQPGGGRRAGGADLLSAGRSESRAGRSASCQSHNAVETFFPRSSARVRTGLAPDRIRRRAGRGLRPHRNPPAGRPAPSPRPCRAPAGLNRRPRSRDQACLRPLPLSGATCSLFNRGVAGTIAVTGSDPTGRSWGLFQ